MHGCRRAARTVPQAARLADSSPYPGGSQSSSGVSSAKTQTLIAMASRASPLRCPVDVSELWIPAGSLPCTPDPAPPGVRALACTLAPPPNPVHLTSQSIQRSVTCWLSVLMVAFNLCKVLWIFFSVLQMKQEARRLIGAKVGGQSVAAFAPATVCPASRWLRHSDGEEGLFHEYVAQAACPVGVWKPWGPFTHHRITPLHHRWGCRMGQQLGGTLACPLIQAKHYFPGSTVSQAWRDVVLLQEGRWNPVRPGDPGAFAQLSAPSLGV